CTTLPTRVAVAPEGADTTTTPVMVKPVGAVMLAEPSCCGDASFVILAVKSVDEPAATELGVMSVLKGFDVVAEKPAPANTLASNATTVATSSTPRTRPLSRPQRARLRPRSARIFIAPTSAGLR